MALPFIQMAREHAEFLREAINEYNKTAVEQPEGPTFRDLVKTGREAGEANESAEATKAYKAYQKALESVNAAKQTLAQLGAEKLGIDPETVGSDVSDEDKETAKGNRKELVSTLKMLIDSSDVEAREWAKTFEIPNVGSDKTQTMSEGGTSRLRVWVDVNGPDGFSERYDSLSAFKVAAQKKDSGIPVPDIDRIRKAYEEASESERKDGITGTIAEGWTATVSPKS